MLCGPDIPIAECAQNSVFPSARLSVDPDGGKDEQPQPFSHPSPCPPLVTRPVMHRERGSRLVSVGTSLPSERLTNADLAAMMDTDDEWIQRRTGISERRRGGTTTGLATAAASQALDRSLVDPEMVDLVIVATQTPDNLCPSTAAGVQHALGLTCGAYDLNAACAGFAYGVVTAHGMLTMPGAPMRAALVVGVDRMTSATNYEDRSTAILFGDGAGAVVLVGTDDPTHGLLGWDVGTDGSRPDILSSPIKDGCMTGVEMDGKTLFKMMVRYATDSARAAVAKAGLTFDDLSAVLAHQANQRILDAVADRLDVDRTKFTSVIAHTGNTSAASVPLALDHAIATKSVVAGDPVLLLGFGGGLSWASVVAVWD
jgi:3-oxoacyl-[acyl-carrier-protein] synthase-3